MDSNLGKLYFLLRYKMNGENAVPIVWGIAVFCTLAALVTERVFRKKTGVNKNPGKKMTIVCRSVLIVALVGICAYNMKFLRGDEVYDWYEWIPQLMVVGICAMSGSARWTTPP